MSVWNDEESQTLAEIYGFSILLNKKQVRVGLNARDNDAVLVDKKSVESRFFFCLQPKDMKDEAKSEYQGEPNQRNFHGLPPEPSKTRTLSTRVNEPKYRTYLRTLQN